MSGRISADGENNQKAIAGYCEIEQATVGNILLGMEKDGLIVRKTRISLKIEHIKKG